MAPHDAETLSGSERPSSADRAGGSEPSPPARVALLSDVHGNLPAFRTVLEDAARTGAEAVWCLGDLVGYGAQPDECVDLARQRCDRCLLGNHDLVALGRLDVSTFSPHAATAASWTAERLGEDAREYLSGLQTHEPEPPVGLFHASPRDPVWEYVLSVGQAAACMDVMPTRVAAIGHSHVALFFARHDGQPPEGSLAPAGTEVDLSSGEWLMNPGGVGQPRDGDPRAAWMLLDLERERASWRRVEYPVEEAARAIEAAELPRALASRLYLGQ
jgi:diadenosine tetraphosphatase ApaH/serine/threonine PP2A family protein phosphatase